MDMFCIDHKLILTFSRKHIRSKIGNIPHVELSSPDKVSLMPGRLLENVDAAQRLKGFVSFTQSL